MMPELNLPLLRLALPFAAVLTSGCASLGVEVWERETLSRPEMQFLERDLGLDFDDHFYFSKEGTSGGRGFAGGGCGCN